jgi:hypothetical protein
LSPTEFIDVMQKRKDGGFNEVRSISSSLQSLGFYLMRRASCDQRRDTGAFELLSRVLECIDTSL